MSSQYGDFLPHLAKCPFLHLYLSLLFKKYHMSLDSTNPDCKSPSSTTQGAVNSGKTQLTARFSCGGSFCIAKWAMT